MSMVLWLEYREASLRRGLVAAFAQLSSQVLVRGRVKGLLLDCRGERSVDSSTLYDALWIQCDTSSYGY